MESCNDHILYCPRSNTPRNEDNGRGGRSLEQAKRDDERPPPIERACNGHTVILLTRPEHIPENGPTTATSRFPIPIPDRAGLSRPLVLSTSLFLFLFLFCDLVFISAFSFLCAIQVRRASHSSFDEPERKRNQIYLISSLQGQRSRLRILPLEHRDVEIDLLKTRQRRRGTHRFTGTIITTSLSIPVERPNEPATKRTRSGAIQTWSLFYCLFPGLSCLVHSFLALVLVDLPDVQTVDNCGGRCRTTRVGG